MGQVFEAVHVNLGRRVALKVLGTHRDAELQKRLEREARTAAQMHHPNIVQVTALHVPETPSEDNPAYLVMEFVEGETLQHRLDTTTRLDAPIVRRIAVQMASALAYAHERGVVHRDVKPDNILLTEVPGVGVVAKLLDFGIARVLEETALTRAGTLVGTPRYMSPEQALGQPVGPASDVFGLGATLYVALFAQPPFPGRSLSELSMQLASPLEAKAPSDATVVDSALIGSVLRCLRKRAEERPASGAELLRELELQERDTQPLPISEHPRSSPSAEATARHGVARRRGLVLALGIAGVLALAALIGFGATRQPKADAASGVEATLGAASSAVVSAPALGSDAPAAGAAPLDLVLGEDRPCLLLSSGEVYCFRLADAAPIAGRVPGTGALHIDAISYRARRLVLRAGHEHWLFFGDSVRVDPAQRRLEFAHAPVALGADEPLLWTCPEGTRGCFVWSRAGMRWADEERGMIRAIETASACQTTPAEVAYPVLGSPWLWLLRCGTISYFLAHDSLRDRLPPEDRFYTRAITGLPARSQLLGAGEGSIKIRTTDEKLAAYHPKLLPPSADPGWRQNAPIDAGYRIPFGPTERVAPAEPGPGACVLEASGIVCESEQEPRLAERGRRLGATFGAVPPRRVWSSAAGTVCALGETANAALPWSLRCIGSDAPIPGVDGEAPRDVAF